MIFDVAIIGAGPAGGSAAFHCAKLGLKTVILEEDKVVGEPVHCGECLSLYATQNTGLKLPKEAISFPVKGIRVIFPDGTTTKVTEEGYILEKHKFEQWLSKEATHAGAELKLNSRVTALKRENETWTLTTASGEIKAKLVIDASGVHGVANKLLQLNKKPDTVIGIQYELEDIPRDDYMDFYLWPEFAPHGYLWMIQKSNGRANVGLVTNDNAKAKKYLDAFVEKMGWKNKKVVKTFGGPIPASGPVANTTADGIILIGDAAGFTSPLFEGGTHLSLKSGQFASQVAKKAIDKNDLSAASLKEYELLWKAEFPPYSKIVGGKHKLYKFTDSELNQIAKCLPEDLSDLNVLDKAKVGAKLLAKNPKLVTKGAIDALLAFGYSRAEHYGW